MTRAQIAQQFTLLNYPIVMSAFLTVAGLAGSLVGSASSNEGAAYYRVLNPTESVDKEAFEPPEPIANSRMLMRSRLLSLSAITYLLAVVLILLFAAFSTVGGTSNPEIAQWRFLWAVVCFEFVGIASLLVLAAAMLDAIAVFSHKA